MTSLAARAARPLLCLALASSALACGGMSKEAMAPPSAPELAHAEEPGGPPAGLFAQGVNVASAESGGRREASDAAKAGPVEASGERKIVRDATVRLEVGREVQIAPALRAVHQVAAQTGGFVFSETNDTVVLKIPANKLDDALARVGRVAKVRDKNVSARDVTSDYVDLNIRIDNARKLQARLKELLTQTQDVGKVLEVEKELARVTEQLERLEGQMRLLSQQTTYATLTVTVEEDVKPGPIGWVFYGAYSGIKWLFVWD
ncbi:MAG TPA: DUF4349 domain-containing protein [Polyangiaceae bacterium]|nr:DUF4349 domain-containing protein [Polyangiaceae bacterium]